ncbi:hypothetical protein NPIL_565011 [Nephila pilipes]|uniref:Uncharacterized protein n=1 Tax=Nephila pilipes TaxID=299642 RepID=A0A8X6MSY3_NEPPI|nr:hypothetical protein NPIL_565011 [Nephila pilipes]
MQTRCTGGASLGPGRNARFAVCQGRLHCLADADEKKKTNDSSRLILKRVYTYGSSSQIGFMSSRSLCNHKLALPIVPFNRILLCHASTFLEMC